jgi:hypothetical protein
MQDGFVFSPLSTKVTISGANVTVPIMTRQIPDEGLSAKSMEYVDSLPESPLSPEEIILPNGLPLAEYAASRGISADDTPPSTSANKAAAKAATTPLPAASGPQQKKADVIAKMLLKAAKYYACGRDPQATRCTTWDYKADPANPVSSPAQTGLTYVHGGRTPDVLTLPDDGCSYKTHGMDCSGLIMLIASAVGLNAPASSSTQAVPDNWKIPPEWQLKWKLVTDGTVESGDLIAWSGHIGIAATKGTIATASVISSTGRTGPTQCLKNITPPRGPRSLKIQQLSTAPPDGLGQPTAVLRLVTTLTGDWTAYIRCTAQTTDAAAIAFKIDNDQGGPFSSTGTGTDYNGAPLSFVLSGNYNQLSNVLAATLAFTDNTRSDSFSQKLLEDDTGYFPLTKVIDNGGCPASARLVRQAATTATAKVLQRPTITRGLPPSMLLRGNTP